MSAIPLDEFKALLPSLQSQLATPIADWPERARLMHHICSTVQEYRAHDSSMYEAACHHLHTHDAATLVFDYLLTAMTAPGQGVSNAIQEPLMSLLLAMRLLNPMLGSSVSTEVLQKWQSTAPVTVIAVQWIMSSIEFGGERTAVNLCLNLAALHASNASSTTRVTPAAPATAVFQYSAWMLQWPELVDFFHALFAAEPDTDGILDFGVHHVWADDDSPTKMLVRDCYPVLYDQIVADEASRSMLTSNSGVGLSYFSLYMLRQVVRSVGLPAKQHVVAWVCHRLNICAVFRVNSDGQVTATELFSRRRGLKYICYTEIDEEDENIVIYDNDKPMMLRPNCKALLISSEPHRVKGYVWCQEDCLTYFMPVWSAAEMQLAQREIFHVPADQFADLHCVFGGIPRHVFDECQRFLPDDGDSDTLKELALRHIAHSCYEYTKSFESLDTIKSAFRTERPVMVGQYIFHVEWPDETERIGDYTDYKLKYASTAVQDLVYKCIATAAEERLAMEQFNSKHPNPVRSRAYMLLANPGPFGEMILKRPKHTHDRGAP